MAENMREIKRRIKSIESTGHITNAMRLVSAARFRKAKARFDRCDGALAQAEGALLTLPGLADRHADALKTEKVLYIVVTSNKGLCGGYNTAIDKAVQTAIEAGELARARAVAGVAASGVAGARGTGTARHERVEICAIGTKGRDFFARLGYPVSGEYDGDLESFSMEEAKALSSSAVQRYLRGELARVVLVQTNYVNSLHQEPVLKQILPPEDEAGEAGVPGATDVPGTAGRMRKELEMIPSARAVAEHLLPLYAALALRRAVIESAVCEHAARRSAMENASSSASDMLESLSLTYNRARQQAITNELIEIVAGAEAQH